MLLVVLYKSRRGLLAMNAETLDKFFDLPDGKHLIIESRMVLKH